MLIILIIIYIFRILLTVYLFTLICLRFYLEKNLVADLNVRPIIGILAQEFSVPLEKWYGDNYTSYIGSSYIKYIEAAGARVVPVLINQPMEYYQTIFTSTNGLLLPGGVQSLDSGK